MAVYELLARLARGEDDEPSTTGPVSRAEGAAPQAPKPWTEESLARLAEGGLPTVNVVVAVLDVLAANPARWLSTDELAAATGKEKRYLRAAFSKLPRHVQKHYGYLNAPMETAWGKQIAGAGSPQQHYRLDQQTSERWRRIRGIDST